MFETSPGPAQKPKGLEEPTLLSFHLAFENKRQGDELLCQREKLPVPLLQKGDTVVVESRAGEKGERREKSFVFKVTGAIWLNLSIHDHDSSPRPVISGRLEGPFIEDQFANEDIYLLGSSLGGTTYGENSIKPGENLYFCDISDKEIPMPVTSDYAIARKDANSDLVILQPSDLNVPNENIERSQEIHAEQIRILMKKFGFENFDLFDCAAPLPSQLSNPLQSYEDENFSAHYSRGKDDDGNEFLVLNKNTGRVVMCKYFDFNEQDMLQVAYADLPNSFSRMGGISISGVYTAGVPIVTFTSSPQLNLNIVTYHMSDTEASEGLKIPQVSGGFVPIPDIQIWPGKDAQIVTQGSIFNEIEEKNSGAMQAIERRVKVTLAKDGRHMFQLGDRKAKIENINEVLSGMLEHTPPTQVEAEKEEALDEIKKSIHLGVLNFKITRDRWIKKGTVTKDEVNTLPEVKKEVRAKIEKSSLNGVISFEISRDEWVAAGVFTEDEVNKFPKVKEVALDNIRNSMQYGKINFRMIRDQWITAGVIAESEANQIFGEFEQE